jgi:Protein of unknown function (DUF2949)
MMGSANFTRFVSFLQDDLAISQDCMAIALRQMENDPGPLPMILWQYGLVTIDQLEKIYDWLETV